MVYFSVVTQRTMLLTDGCCFAYLVVYMSCRGSALLAVSSYFHVSRGLVALEVLRELENLTGKAPCDLFDYFIGVSTGAVVAAMLASFKLSAQESVEFYKRTCISLFARDTLQGAKRLILSHGWYDTTAWETVLK